MNVYPGRHDATIKEVRLETAQTGSECVAVVCEVEGQGTITWRGWLTDAAIEFTVKALEQVGWDREKYEYDIDTVVDVLPGNPCSIVCEEDTYEGKTRVVVKYLNGTDYVGGPVSDDRKKALQDRIRALGGKPTVAKRPEPKAPEPQTQEAAVVGDDDTPF